MALAELEAAGGPSPRAAAKQPRASVPTSWPHAPHSRARHPWRGSSGVGAVGPTQEIKPSSSVVSEQCPQELVFPGSGAACAVSRMRHHPFSRTNNRQELPLAAAPTSSGCPRGDPFPPDDLPASSPAAQQSSITSGFLTLKLGRGGGVRVAFVCVQSHGKNPKNKPRDNPEDLLVF